MIIEVIATTLQEALDVEKFGADRIELISNFEEGGLTPSKEIINEVLLNIQIPVNIMIRTHSHSFYYTQEEIELMKKEVKYIQTTKANGIVFGALTQENKIDIDALKEIISVKGDLELTFHRAFDMIDNQIEAIETLKKFDVKRVLTSGSKASCIEGKEDIHKLLNNTKESSLILLAGAGLKPTNLKSFITNLPIKEIHLGTGVRENYQVDGKIDPNKMLEVLTLVK